MDLKKEVKEIIKWASKSKENKQQVKYMTKKINDFLNTQAHDQLNDEELEKITGANSFWCSFLNACSFEQCKK
jgi:hypothetical protein